MGNSESFQIELETNGNGTKAATEVENWKPFILPFEQYNVMTSGSTHPRDDR